MIQDSVIINNKLGLHARAATKLVHLASKYESDIKLCSDHKTVDAKRIMDVMLLAAGYGTRLDLYIQGPDETSAWQAITELIRDNFHETQTQ